MFSWKRAGAAAGLLCAFLVASGCGDYYRPIANPIISPGGDIQPIHYAFVLYSNPNGPGGTMGPGSLQQIDVSGDSVMLNIDMGRDPLFASFLGSATGEVFAVNKADGTVTEQTFTTAGPPSVTTLPSGSAPVFVGGRQTSATYVLNTVAPTLCPQGAVNVLTTNNVVTDTACVGSRPVALTQIPNGGDVYIINQGDSTVSVMDPVSLDIVATVPVGSNPVWATTNLDGSYVFVVNQGSNNLTAIKTSDNSTSTISVGTSPNYAIFDGRRNRLYVTNGGSNTVSILDLSKSTPAVLNAAVPTGSNPTGIVPLADGTRFYVANTGSNSVTAYDANSNTAIKTISLGTPASTSVPLWIESEPTSTKVYVTTPAPAANAIPENNPNGAAGVTILRTDINGISNFLQAPQGDPNCQVNPQAGHTCSYQVPLQILTVAR